MCFGGIGGFKPKEVSARGDGVDVALVGVVSLADFAKIVIFIDIKKINLLLMMNCGAE